MNSLANLCILDNNPNNNDSNNNNDNSNHNSGQDIVDTRNTENTYTSVNTITETQSVQLGSYEDAHQVSSSAVAQNTYQAAYEETNMETFTLDQVLNREYPVATITWNTGAVGELAAINFPDVLFNKPFIADKLRDFRLFKGGIRLSVRVGASQFLYGKIMVSYDPMTYNNSRRTGLSTGSAALYTNSGYPHILISASASEAGILDVPFINDKRALDIPNYLTGEMGTFRIHVLNELRNILAEPGSCTILVTAQFINAKVFLPHDRFVPQSKRHNTKEADNKAYRHTISQKYENSFAETAGIAVTKLVRPVEDFYETVLKPGAAAMTMLGLSKPTSLDRTAIVKVNPFHDYNTGKGIDTSVSFGMDPDNQISCAPVVGGITEDEMSLKYVVGTPSLVGIYSFVNGSSPLRIGSSGPFEAAYQLSFVDFITQNFNYWSGSYKFKIYITASNMHSIKGVFYLSDSPETDQWENCYHKVVDIQGDTEVMFSIPYTSPLVVSRVTNNDYDVYFRILSWSQASGASSPITLNVYKAGGSDFRFGALREMEFQVQSNPRKDFAHNFEPLHPSMTGYIPENIVFGEEYTTIREIIHRYFAYGATNSTLCPHYRGIGTSAVNVYTGVELFGLLYRFWRGSMRWKFIQKDTNVRIFLPYLNGSDVATNTKLVSAVFSSSANPVAECSLPYYDNILFHTTRPANDTGMGVWTDIRAGQYETKAAGDDFSFHFLCGPPFGSLVRCRDTYGTRNLRTFLAT